MELAATGDTAGAIALVFGDEYAATIAEINTVTDTCIQDVQNRMSRNQTILNMIMMISMGIFILCFLINSRKIITTLAFAKKELLLPVVKVSDQIQELARGHFEDHLDLPEDDSEVGTMVRAIHFMNDNFTKMVTEISRILGEMGEGNYQVAPTEEYVGDFIQIKESMEKIIADTRNTLSTIRNTANDIGSGSEQLAQAATDLAEGCTRADFRFLPDD